MSSDVGWEGNPIPQDIDIEDQPEGGANALNVNRYIGSLCLVVFWTIRTSANESTLTLKLYKLCIGAITNLSDVMTSSCHAVPFLVS